MRFCSLASGSEGNAALVWTDTTRILVDCGLSVKQLGVRLASIGEHLDNLSAIVVSHEHTDHVSGLARVVREGIRRGNHIPAYLTRETAEHIKWGGMDSPPVKLFDAGGIFEIGDISVGSFTLMHDAADPVGFTFSSGQYKFGYALDLGSIHDNLRKRLRSCDVIYMESNYDPGMLESGDYPEPLKERIMSRSGHLSNDDVAEFIRNDMGDGVGRLVLGHLSQPNNTPEKVMRCAMEAVGARKLGTSVQVATQNEVLAI